MQTHILLVDDEVSILKALERLLRRSGYKVSTAEGGAAALKILAEQDCSVVISDFRMPVMTGDQLLLKIKHEYPHCICMMLSGYADFNAVIGLLNSGTAFRFLQKPWDDDSLLAEIESAVVEYQKRLDMRIRNQFLLSSQEALLELTVSGQLCRSNAAAQHLLKLTAAELSVGNLMQLFPELDNLKQSQILGRQKVGQLCQYHGQLIELDVQMTDAHFVLIKMQVADELPALVDSTVNLPQVLSQSDLIRKIDSLMAMSRNVVVVVLQIKDFQLINDIIGFAQAEQLFEKIADTLLQGMSSKGYLGYLANEQFVLLFDLLESEAELHRIINQVLQPLSDVQLLCGRIMQVNFLVAYCMAPEDGLSGRSLLNNALVTLRLNSKGKHSFPMRYDVISTENRKTHMQLSEALYRAIDQNELQLVFQPKLCVKRRQLHSAEALLRWHNPKFGAISPAVFIPIAEQDGQIIELGYWVLRQSCLALAAWQRQGLVLESLSVNVSGIQLQQADFVEQVSTIIARTGVNPALIELEITESSVIEHFDNSSQKLKQLRALGVSLSIDDFGNGYSSLAYLTKLPVQVVKVDRSLIIDIDGNLPSQNMLRNMVRMSHDLELVVVIEGVETMEQFRLLEQMQADFIQGFLISKPLSDKAFSNLLQQGSALQEAKFQ